jgi:hypothetical protein
VKTKTPTVKKVAKKETIPESFKYVIEFVFNGFTFNVNTNDINDAIMYFKPEILYTDIYITVKDGEFTMERHLNLKQGKNLFINNDFREIFINNLMIN